MKKMNATYVCMLILTLLLSNTSLAMAGKERNEASTTQMKETRRAVEAEYANQSRHSFAEAGTQDSSFGNVNSTYTLGADDVIEIMVLRHPEVSGQFVVNNAGNIQYDFVGDLNVAGQTKDDLINVLTDKLSEYIISPELNV